MLAMTITATLTPMSVPTSVSILQSGPISSESDVAVLTPFPASTEFPLPLVNPATLAPKDIFIYLGKGILAVVVVFVLVSLIFFLRHK
jgi:hypothetical protein